MIVGKNKATLLTKLAHIREACSIAEHAGRLSHDSVDKMTEDSYEEFLRTLIKRGHMSVLEHINLSFLIETSRSASHEIVRHRHCAFTEKSTRYCEYDSTLDIVFDVPEDSTLALEILSTRTRSTKSVYKLLKTLTGKDLAREVLPNCTATKLVMTTNLREWLHFIEVRNTPEAHPVVRDIARQINDKLKGVLPWVFV